MECSVWLDYYHVMYCSKVHLHGLEEWCVGVVPAEPENQFKPGSAGRQSGSQAQ